MPAWVMIWRAHARKVAHREHVEQAYRRRLAQNAASAKARVTREASERSREHDRLLIQRANVLEAARGAATGELAELVAEQAKDERYGGRVGRRPWLVSLDATDKYGRELYETIAAE